MDKEGENIDFSQAIRSSNLGEALCVLNPLQQKNYEQQAACIDRAKKRREATLFQNQRHFFIAQVFGKGLNPHLIRSSEDEEDMIQDPPEVSTKNPHQNTILQDRKPEPAPDIPAYPTRSSLSSKTTARNTKTTDDVTDPEEEAKRVKKRKTVMITEPAEIINNPPNKAFIHRAHTSSELSSSNKHSKSMTSLPVVKGSDNNGGESSNEGGVGRLKERSKSTSHIGTSVKKKVVITPPEMLPSIHRNPGSRKSSASLHDDVSEEYDLESRSDYAASVHTTTDHVGISTKIRAEKKDMSFLKRNPTRLFPKMKLLLNSYEPSTQGTFNQIMEIGDEACTLLADLPSRRPAGKLGTSSLSNNSSPSQRVRIKLREHKRGHISADEGPNHRSGSRFRNKNVVPRNGRTSGRIPVRALQSQTDTGVYDGEDNGGDSAMKGSQGKDLTETQKYVKMIQQMTSYLPPHMLATAEEQISKMSNTEGIMKFKKQMIEKNQSLMQQDTKTDPRWRRLERMLSPAEKHATWHQSSKSWIYY